MHRMQPVLAIGLLLSAAQLATGFGVGSPAWIRGPGMYSLARSVEMYESGRVAYGFGTCHLVPAPTAMAYNNFGAVGSVQQQRMGLAQEFGGRIVLVKDEQGWRDVRSAAAQTGAILCAEFRAQYCRKCMALEAKYKNLPKKYEGQAVIFAEINAQKVGIEVRREADVQKVPVFQIWHQDKKIETYLAGDLGVVMGHVSAMIDRNLEYANNDEFKDVRAVSVGMSEQVTEDRAADKANDALKAWRAQQQQKLVHAPGISVTQSSTTHNRNSAGDQESPVSVMEKNVVAAREFEVPETKVADSRKELEALQEKSQVAAQALACEGEGDDVKTQDEQGGQVKRGWSTADDLRAELDALTAKKKQQG